MAGRRRIAERTAREVAELFRAEASGLFNQARVLAQGDRALGGGVGSGRRGTAIEGLQVGAESVRTPSSWSYPVAGRP